MISLDNEGEKARSHGAVIPCCVGSPSLNFITRPLKIRIRNQREIETVKLYQPFTVEYEIVNLTNSVIAGLVELQTYNDFPQRGPFMIAGEIKSRI